MYTVLTTDGQPKINRLGHVVFTRTLADARRQCDVGESVITWSRCGAPVVQRRRGDDGRLRVLKGARS